MQTRATSCRSNTHALLLRDDHYNLLRASPGSDLAFRPAAASSIRTRTRTILTFRSICGRIPHHVLGSARSRPTAPGPDANDNRSGSKLEPGARPDARWRYAAQDDGFLQLLCRRRQLFDSSHCSHAPDCLVGKTSAVTCRVVHHHMWHEHCNSPALAGQSALCAPVFLRREMNGQNPPPPHAGPPASAQTPA